MEKPRVPISAAVLAGGRNTRMNGRNKALMVINGRRMIDRVLSVLREVADEVVVVANDPAGLEDLDLVVASDVVEAQSALSGIHAALLTVSHGFCFTVPCDLPFLRPELAAHLAGLAGEGWDAVVPRNNKGYEPLCAVYSRRCIKPVERALASQDLRIRKVFPEFRVREVGEVELRRYDPDLVSFSNVNTPEDLAVAERTARVLDTK